MNNFEWKARTAKEPCKHYSFCDGGYGRKVCTRCGIDVTEQVNQAEGVA